MDGYVADGRRVGGCRVVLIERTDHHRDIGHDDGQGDGCSCFSVELLSLGIIRPAWLEAVQVCRNEAPGLVEEVKSRGSGGSRK